MTKKKIAAIIQARMGSTRLPGKVLMDIEGKPMLYRVMSRLKYAKKFQAIILAIPDTKENDILEEFAESNEIKYFRGSEKDVLGRYYEAAKKFKVDVIVRITADCPLIDPKIVDTIIKRHLNSGADYTSNTIKRTFPHGLDAEVFNFDVLKRAHYQAKEQYQREHVTPYIYERPKVFRLRNVAAIRKIRQPDLRLTVDTPEDLELLRAIYQRLAGVSPIFFAEDIIELFGREPGLAEINAGIHQKILKE